MVKMSAKCLYFKPRLLLSPRVGFFVCYLAETERGWWCLVGDRQTETDRQTDRQTATERDRDRDRETERVSK